MQTERLVDVFALSGRRIGRYTVDIAICANEKLAERRAIDEAIRNGDIGEADRSRLVAAVRKLTTSSWLKAA